MKRSADTLVVNRRESLVSEARNVISSWLTTSITQFLKSILRISWFEIKYFLADFFLYIIRHQTCRKCMHGYRWVKSFDS